MIDKSVKELTEEEKLKAEKAEISPNPVVEMGKGSIISLDDYVLQPCRKEAKRQTILKSLIPMGEERFLTVNNGSLYVFKRAPKLNIAVKNLGRFFSKQIPEDQ